jgi:GTP-binding protein
VAAYPFTTLRPQLGRVAAEGGGEKRDAITFSLSELEPRATLADIPGLVTGAHANRGLGHAFLRHVERCGALLLVVDLGASPTAQLRMLRSELAAYDASLAARPTLVVGSKLDLPGARRALAGLRRSAAAAGLPPPLGVSASSQEGLAALRAAVLAVARGGVKA